MKIVVFTVVFSLFFSLSFCRSNSIGHKNDLFSAIEENNSRLVAEIIKKGEDVNTKDAKGRTPLIRAAMLSSFSIAKLLVDNGAKVDEQDMHGKTALMYACLYPHLNINVVTLLLQKKANANIGDKYNNTILYYLYKTYELTPEEKIVGRAFGITRRAMRRDYKKVIELLEKYGAKM